MSKYLHGNNYHLYIMKGAIVTIGDEILIGQIVDTNSAWLGNEMTMLGIEVVDMMTIPDNTSAIHTALDKALDVADLIVLTGGLGPTKDDITKKALAQYVDSDLYMDEALASRIKNYFDSRNIPFIDAHKEQCLMPSKAESLTNKMGTAPGMLFEYQGKYILSMPGVPYEMKYIFKESFVPRLSGLRTEEFKIFHKTIKTVGKGESRIAQTIADIVDQLPAYITISYLPSVGQVKLRLTARDKQDRSAEVNKYVQLIADRIPDVIFGYDKISLAESLQNSMIEKGLTLSTAESCTGGYLAHQLTSIPGASKYYMGSIIAYDYEPKKKLLKVRPETLEQTGAVSEETVREMLSGLLDQLGTDLGIAISGIAGPGGGLPDKPVGTIWMAWGSKSAVRTKKLTLSKNREKNIEYTAVAGMNALRKFITESN